MDKELSKQIKGLVDDVKTGHAKMEDTITELGKKVDSGEISSQETAKAVAQLEKDHKALQTDVTAKLAKFERQSTDPRNGSYRGHFGSVDNARAFGLFVGATVLGVKNPSCQQRCLEVLKADHAGYLNEKGQFDTTDAAAAIPEGFMNVVVNLTERYGVWDRLSRRFPMMDSSTPYPKIDSRLTVFYPDEGTAPTDSELGMAKLPLRAKKQACLTYITNEVFEDIAITLAELIAEDIARAFGFDTDRQGFIGDTAGGAEPQQFDGVVKSLGAAATKTGSGNAWANLTLDDYAEVMGLVLFAGDPDNAWFVSRQHYFQAMVPLILDSGGRTMAETQGGLAFNMLGSPVEFTQVMPTATAANATAALYGSLRAGTINGDRRAMTIKQSTDYKFAEDVTTILATRRWAAGVHGSGTADQVEAIAGLKTAA